MKWKTKAIKVIIYIILLILFVYLYMIDIIGQFASQKTNFAKSDNLIQKEGLSCPALTFCSKPLIKPSMKKLYNLTSLFCFDANSVDETNKFILTDANMTWNEFCFNISYQINKDFTMEVLDKTNKEGWWLGKGGTKLKVGDNYFKGEKVEIRQILTKYGGLCHTILTDLVFSGDKAVLIRISAMVCISLFHKINHFDKSIFKFFLDISKSQYFFPI